MLPWLFLAFGVYKAVSGAWLSDDAFISFRYARNLALHGELVFNLGERVEGITNLLWTLVLAALYPFIRPEFASLGLGILSYIGVGILLIRRMRATGWRLSPSLIVWCVCPAAFDFATGGLETCAVAFVCLLLHKTVIGLAKATTRRGFAAGALMGAAFLLRPDAALAGLLLASVDARSRKGRKFLFSALLVASAVIVAVTTWRFLYFHDVVPNTFYAKSAAKGNLLYGLRYLGLHVLMYPLLPVCVVGLFSKFSPGAPPRGVPLFVCIYLGYVVYVGGDFMWSRFLVHVLPLSLLGLDSVVASLSRSRQRITLPLLAGLLFTAPHRGGALQDLGVRYGVFPENAIYEQGAAAQSRQTARRLLEIVGGSSWKVAAYGTQMMPLYYAEMDYVLESESGLTDRELARTERVAPGRPGHDKPASLAYLGRRGIDFVVGLPRGKLRLERAADCEVDGFEFWILSRRGRRICDGIDVSIERD